MKKLKAWIINKLGGITIASIPTDILQQLLNRWTNQTIDKHYADTLMSGFSGVKTEYKPIMKPDTALADSKAFTEYSGMIKPEQPYDP